MLPETGCHAEVVVAGGGAAGLFAAIASGQAGARTLLLEKNKKPGVKILMSGGTRCNITQNTDWRGVAAAFGGDQARFLKFALASFPPSETISFFERAGVKTKVESTGKIFPASDSAVEVRDALVESARSSGVELVLGAAIREIEKTQSGFRLFVANQEVTCQRLIVTTGGQSYPGCGTVGDGYRWLQSLGHRIIAPRPALTPLRMNLPWVRELTGVAVADTLLTVRPSSGERRRPSPGRDSHRSAFLFTHRGCSGPAVLNVSGTVTDPANVWSKVLVCDWLPDTNEQKLRDLFNADQSRNRTVGQMLPDELPRRLVAELCRLGDVDINRRLGEIGKKRIHAMIRQIKACEMPIDGTLGFAKAEVTAGGVALDEVHPLSMASRIVPGLFLAGEILDVDGPIGGYNFQAAWSTGRLAGISASTAL